MLAGKTLISLLLQKQSDLGLPSLSRPVWQTNSVVNFRTFTIDEVHIIKSGNKNGGGVW